MDSIIYEYITTYFKVSKNCVYFNGTRIYYKNLKKHLSDLFDLEGGAVDIYLRTYLSSSIEVFSYHEFTRNIKTEPFNGDRWLAEHGVINRTFNYQVVQFISGETNHYFVDGLSLP